MAENAPPAPTAKPAVLAPPAGPDGQPMAVPQEQSLSYAAPQQQPPKKGLEYLALGLGLLFPGAPIAHAAAGFATGLGLGSQNRYKNDTANAQEQFKVQEANAQNEYKGAVAKYGAASDEAQRAFVNQQQQNGADQATAEAAWKANVADLNRRQTLWQAGMGGDGKPVPLPPALARALPPNAPATAYVQQSMAQAKWYGDHGMGQKADELNKQASDYQKQVDQQDKFNQQMQMLDIRQAHSDELADRRAQNSENLAVIREQGTIAREEAARSSRELVQDVHQMQAYRIDANHAYNTASADLTKLTKPTQKIGPDGTPTGESVPPLLDKPGIAVLNKKLAEVRGEAAKGGDPQAYARFLAGQDSTPPAVGQVLQDYGTAFDLEARGRGRVPADLGEDYYAKMFAKKAPSRNSTTGIPAPFLAKYKALPQEAQASIQQGLAAGRTLDQIRQTAVEHGFADVVTALTPPTLATRPGPPQQIDIGKFLPHASPPPAPRNYHLPVTGQ